MSCPALVPPFSVINNVLTNNSTLLASTTKTAVGTEVTLGCRFNYTLVADSPVVVCQQNQTWNFTTTPACEPPIYTIAGLTEDQKIILAVAGGVGGLVLIVLLVMVCLIIRARSKEKKGDRLNAGSLPPDGYLGPPMDTYPQRFDYPYDQDPYRQDTFPREKPYAQPGILPPLRHTNYDNMAFSHEPDQDYRQSRRKTSMDMDRVPDRSYNTQPFPPRAYDRDNDLRRETRTTPRNISENARPQYTNAVRMYEEYGRPQRVGMLEDAYGMNMDRRSISSSFNFATRVTPRSIDSYQSRGGDPTRFYRGNQY